ncbi:uncharacterized protein [Phyllobates terribilis]|uniref:uncharacterized protein isoform X2 n=1 Tax=Phyllobates terribilis TaxID=111132 RepID=UPI003CCACEDB
MKIAIFFLLVGLSSCFVADHYDHGELESCPGRISLAKGQVLVTMVVELIHTYAKLKKEGMEDSWKKIILINKAFTIVNDDPELALYINAPTKVLMDAVCCSARKFIDAEGLNFLDILGDILSGLTPFIGELLTSVTDILGSALNVPLNLVNSVNGLVNDVGDLLDGLLI